MRTKEFSFKKTTKLVKHFNGISVDLTPDEAALLAECISKNSDETSDEEFDAADKVQQSIGRLFDVLKEFAEKHGQSVYDYTKDA